MKYVVVIYDPENPQALKAYVPVGGGFIDMDTAQQWAQTNCGDLSWVITNLEVAS